MEFLLSDTTWHFWFLNIKERYRIIRTGLPYDATSQPVLLHPPSTLPHAHTSCMYVHVVPVRLLAGWMMPRPAAGGGSMKWEIKSKCRSAPPIANSVAWYSPVKVQTAERLLCKVRSRPTNFASGSARGRLNRIICCADHPVYGVHTNGTST